MKTTKKTPRVRVVQDETKARVSVEVIAQSIIEISKAAKAMRSAGLNDRGLIVLLHDLCPGVKKSDIVTVLNALGNLESYYLTKKVESKGGKNV